LRRAVQAYHREEDFPLHFFSKFTHPLMNVTEGIYDLVLQERRCTYDVH